MKRENLAGGVVDDKRIFAIRMEARAHFVHFCLQNHSRSQQCRRGLTLGVLDTFLYDLCNFVLGNRCWLGAGA